jgi:glycosyltransferase involved in cell wall biosynthesis
MNNVLYLGNKFFKYKNVKSVMETLEPLLSEFCTLKTASDKEHQGLRFIDMLYHFFRYAPQADKIIIDVYSTKAFYFAYAFAQLSKIFCKKYILFLHGGNLPHRYAQSQSMVEAIFSKADAIIAPSPYLKTFFESKGYSVQHIPNIIELEQYPYKCRDTIKPRFLALRGFGKPYNPLMTLKAMLEIKKSYNDFHLLMLGNENEYYYKDVVAFVQKHNLTENILIKTKMTRDNWVKLSQEYDIMISNPVIDNTPVSLIEGMALGMCVISTRVGGVPYLLNEGYDGFMISNNSAEELVFKIKFLLHQDKIFSFISNNARKKSEEFSWENVKNIWLKILT